MKGINIISTGKGIPGKIVTNDDLSKIVDTSDEWISSRTGIKSRHYCENEENWNLAIRAAEMAIERAGIDRKDIGLLIVATFTPDNGVPSVACTLQKEMGLTNKVTAFDINAACSGFIYALKIANALLDECSGKYALIIGSEKISTRLDMEDRNTCVLFGDGAGAVLIERNEEHMYNCVLEAEGNYEALGCKSFPDGKQKIYMDGKLVFKYAVSTMTSVTQKMMAQAGITMDDVDYVICHQANERIIKSVVRQLKAPEEKFFVNIYDYGNTSAASIPIALNEMYEKGMLKPGMKIVLTGFGAGFTSGAALIEI